MSVFVTPPLQVTKGALQVINRERDDIEMKASSRTDVEKTHSMEDTLLLISAVTHGKALRPHTTGGGPPGPSGAGQRGGPPGGAPGGGPPQPQQPGPKAPSTIKTNIKAASQVHPYQR